MQKLVQSSAAERKRLVDQFVTRAFDGIAADAPVAGIALAMRSMPAELPDDPNDAQLEAWIELAELLADPAFAARVREMAVAGANAVHKPIDIAAIREHAGAALAAGLAPDAPGAAAVLERILPGSSSAERAALREQLDTFNDVRVERYWQLMAALHARPAFPSVAPACAWTSAALSAHAEPRCAQK